MKRSFLITVVLSAGLSSAAFSQDQPTQTRAPSGVESQEKLPAADEIIARFVKEVGGGPAIEKIESELQTGSFEFGGDSMAVELSLKVPNKWRIEIKMPDGSEFKQVCNGKTAWRLNPQEQEWEEMPRDAMLTTSRMLDLQAPIHIKETFAKREVKGKQKVGNREAFLLKATPTVGPAQDMYFDVENGLLLRVDFTIETEQGTFATQNFFEDYREFEGTRIPFTVRQESNESWVMKIKEIKRNIALDDKQFEKPPAN